VFENRVLRRIFGPKRDEMVGSWRKLHNKEVNNLYISTNIIECSIKENEKGRACSMHAREEECIQGFGWKARRKETTRKTSI
jgi:hypothetical protein